MIIRIPTKQRNYSLQPFQLLILLIFSICNISAKDNSLIIGSSDLAGAVWIGAQEGSLLDEICPAPNRRANVYVSFTLKHLLLVVEMEGKNI